MIRPSSIALAEMIAVAKPNFKPTDIIIGLNDVTHSIEAYTDNYRKEIVDNTASESTEHTATMTAGSERFGEIIRGAMENISAYGKPLAVAIARAAEICYSRSMLRETANANFKHRFVWLDDPYFDSPVYPTEVKDKTFAYTNVGLGALERLKFEYPSNEQVIEFVNSNHADVVEIMRERDTSASSAAYLLVDNESLRDYFVTSRESNFDFSRVKHLDSERVLKAYIILTKMYGSDNPVPWFKSGSLQDYREYVTVLWNAMTSYLINLKQVILAYRKDGLVIQDEMTARMVDGVGAEQHGVRFLEADTVVYYTDKVMEAITQGSSNSLSEVLLGYYWDALTGERKRLAEVVSAPGQFQAKANEYYNYVNEKLSGNAQVRFVETAVRTIVEFIETNSDVRARLTEIRGNTGEMLIEWVVKTFSDELARCYHHVNNSGYQFGEAVVEGGEGGVSVSDSVMSSKIIPVFLRSLRCELAAELLEGTYVTQAAEDNIHDQRERLTVAVVNLIVNKSLS